MKKSRKKFDIAVESFGLYTKWDRNSKQLPDIVEFTDTIPAVTENEFGMIVHIRKGKGIKLYFLINHPPFKNKQGKTEPDFTGEHIVSSNDYRFFIGDNIWEPVEDKKGEWVVSLFFKDQLIARQKFSIV